MLGHVLPRAVVGVELRLLLNHIVLILVHRGHRGRMHVVEIINQRLRLIRVQLLRAQVYVDGILHNDRQV